MFVPIVIGEKVLGAVAVSNYPKNAFNANDLRLLQTLSANMAVAIQNARLFEAEQQRNAELAVINSIQQGLAAELNFQAIVDLVGDKLSQVFTNGDIGVRWYDPRSKLLHFLYEYEHGLRLSLLPKQMDGEKARLFEERRTPLVLNDRAAMEEAGLTILPGTDRSLSVVMVPIIGSDHVIGQIDVENYERENAYSESDIRLLTTIAGSLGAALQNAFLFDETQRLLKETEQRNAELAVINSIQQGLAAELNFQAIVDLVGDKLRAVFNLPDLFINWYEEKTKEVTFLYCYEHGQRLTLKPLALRPDSIIARAIQTRQPVLWNTLEEGDKLGPVLSGTDASKSGISIPMISADRVLGVIQLENYEREHAFGDAEIRLLTTITASLGAALENARLFNETQQRNSELAVINSIQQGLAAKLNFQDIVDLVGDRLREVFQTRDLSVSWYDEKTDLVHTLYIYEHGERLTIPARPPSPDGVIRTRRPVIWNTLAEGDKLAPVIPGTDASKSGIRSP